MKTSTRCPHLFGTALVAGKFVTLRIPYPLGFYAKGLEGRIRGQGHQTAGRPLPGSSITACILSRRLFPPRVHVDEE
jgi:hypothetical protein